MGSNSKIPAEIPSVTRIAQTNDLKEDDEHNGDDNGYRNLPSNVVGGWVLTSERTCSADLRILVGKKRTMWPFKFFPSRRDKKSNKRHNDQGNNNLRSHSDQVADQLTARQRSDWPKEVMFADSSLVISSNWGLISEETRLSRKSSMVALAFPNKLASYERNSPLVVGRMESLQLDPKLKSTAIKKKTKEIAKSRLSPFLSRKSTIGLSR